MRLLRPSLAATTSNQTLGVPRLSEAAKDYRYLGKRPSGYDKNASDKKTLGQKRIQQPISTLFKDDNFPFYFDDSLKAQLKTLMHKVFMNSGAVLAQLDVIKSKEFNPKGVYCIIPDGKPDLIKKIKDEIGDKAQFLSPRWINYCMERSSVISIKYIKERAMVNLLPIELPTPYPDFQNYKVSVMKEHFDLDRAFSLESLVEILGFQSVTTLSKT